MNLFSSFEILRNVAEMTALEILSKDLPMSSLEELNEPIDSYSQQRALSEGLHKKEEDRQEVREVNDQSSAG